MKNRTAHFFEEVTREHVLEACRLIDRDGVPPRRKSRDTFLVVDGEEYPAKYVLGLAYELVHDARLEPDRYTGGEPTAAELTERGFEVMYKGELWRPDGEGSVTPPLESLEQVSRSAEPKEQPEREGEKVPARIARLVMDGRCPGTPRKCASALREAVGQLSEPVDFLVTPGGFLARNDHPTWEGSRGWESRPEDIEPFVEHSLKLVEKTMGRRVRRALSGKVSYVTLGVDHFTRDRSAHAELVLVYDVDADEVVHWTGKSYPVHYQTNDLIQVVELDTHFVELKDWRLAVLGCHDLNMLSNRSRFQMRKGSRKQVRASGFEERMHAFEPDIIIQHPHTIDTPKIWSTAWSGARERFPNVKQWVSGMCYWNGGRQVRGELDASRAATASDDVLDIIVKSPHFF